MITSAIGKKFLKAYNEKYKTDYDAKRFFTEIFYPLFFDHNKYMMWVQNSPFVQMKKEQKVENLTPNDRKEKLITFFDKIKTERDASIAIGFPSLDINATTSGQVSNIKLPINEDDIYLSWIGGGLSVGIQGGISILFDQTEVLLTIYKGWELYRTVLNATNNLKGNQINTWNGQWLAHFYNKRLYYDDNPMANFNPFEENNGLLSLKTQSWTKILIRLSQSFSNPQMMGYVYNIGQMNTTIGFIPFALNQIRKPIELYQKFFNMDSGNDAESLWGTAMGFSKACQTGIIGIKAMEPKGLTEYIKGKIPKYSSDESKNVIFKIYIIWILAMLNNEELWNIALDFAKELENYSHANSNPKKDKTNKVNMVISASNKATFIKALTDIVSDADNKEQIEKIAFIINRMPNDNVPYLLTLMRFHYASINNIKTK